MVAVLHDELLQIEAQFDGLNPPAADAPAEDKATWIRLDARRSLVRDRYEIAVRQLEARRLDDLVEGARAEAGS